VRGTIILISVSLPRCQPLSLSRAHSPFSHPDWFFEVKWDGFRALLYSGEEGVRLVSRNGNTFKSFPGLCDGLARDLKGRRCVLDGEIVCLDPHGKPQFRDLLFRRAEPRFIAFDILWEEHAKTDDEQEQQRFRNGEDLRYLPLIDRKLRLHAVVPKRSERLQYCDHIDGDGEGLFRLACEHDLEGIVAKRKSDPYLPEHAKWLKIRNQAYSQWVGREELFERERGSDPDFQVWDGCALACEEISPNHDVAASGFEWGKDEVVPVADFFGADNSARS
jgi:ATP-dependent DNA ligase